MGVFGQSLFATPPRVGGVQLQPFSAFHAQALMELDSPFITGTRDPVEGETAVALVVCSSLRKDGLSRVQRLLSSPWARLCWNVRWLFRDHTTAANELAEHVTSSAVCPQTWEEQGDGKGSSTGADWPYYVVSIMAQNLHGIPFDELWDMPLAELICHKVILAEANGQVKIAERDLENMRKLKESAA